MFNLWDLKKKNEDKYGVLSVEGFSLKSVTQWSKPQ